MKKKVLISLILLVLLTTITSQQKVVISKFNLSKIKIENNFLVSEEDIKKSLSSIYNKNLFFLDHKKIEKVLTNNSFIEGFKIKKIYPNTLKIEIFEKKPIAIIFDKKKKYYLSDKIDLIEFVSIQDYDNLPLVLGSKDKFRDFYNDLRKINFPINLIEKYIFYESNRWDIEINNKKLIKLPIKNYLKSLENYLDLINNHNFNKYKIFDYRIENQIVIK